MPLSMMPIRIPVPSAIAGDPCQTCGAPRNAVLPLLVGTEGTIARTDFTPGSLRIASSFAEGTTTATPFIARCTR